MAKQLSLSSPSHGTGKRQIDVHECGPGTGRRGNSRWPIVAQIADQHVTAAGTSTIFSWKEPRKKWAARIASMKIPAKMIAKILKSGSLSHKARDRARGRL